MEVVKHRFGDNYALWFAQTSSFLLLKEPAYLVYELLEKGEPLSSVIRICQRKYGTIETNIPGFVNEVAEKLRQYNDEQFKNSISRKQSITGVILPQQDANILHYKVANKSIAISYANQSIKHSIHPVIAHLECKALNAVNDKVDLLSTGDYLVIKYNEKIVEAFEAKHMNYFTGTVKQLLISILYDKRFSNWMAMLHASGVCKDDKCMLFSAASGSGKSTIAAILKAQGYTYLSDDFIAADSLFKAYAFPDAISVKEGAFKVLTPFYPELENYNTFTTWNGKLVKYIPVKPEIKTGVRVKAFIFVNYSASATFEITNVDKITALQLLLKESWVNTTSEMVETFFKWVQETPFYQLSYSKTEDVRHVAKIFSN